MGLDPSLIRVLADEAADLVPLLGAGLSVDAGVPAGGGLARELERDAGRPASEDAPDFTQTCRSLEDELGRTELQVLAARVLERLAPRPTLTLQLLARCPNRVILTTNYDLSVELSAERVGLAPVSLLATDARAVQPPAALTLHVVHLHGLVSEPSSLVLSTAHRRELRLDARFHTAVRALLAGRRALCLGFRLSLEEEHLRDELSWLASAYGTERSHVLLLPEAEAAGRQDLGVLVGDQVVELHPFPDEGDYVEVRQVALLLAPTEPNRAETVGRVAEPPSPYYRDPPPSPRDTRRGPTGE